MPGTAAGAAKRKARRIAEIGEEAYKEEQRRRGLKAKRSRPKHFPFAEDPELARRAGRKGGINRAKSRRKQRELAEEEQES